MFGSGRAILTLRESYRDDIRAVKQVTDFRYVRFHAILHDEVGVYNEDEHGNPVYNFAYVDQIYDGLLKHGVRPFVEISFMPKKLAFNPDALHPFWYKQNVSPPKSMEGWDALMTHFAQHLVDRYGIDEVSKWYFEVWNEPNIDFWNGIPRKQSYFDLYAHTARALKGVNPRLRVGGPATAAAAWVPDFLKYAAANHVPVDFVSTHGYADDTVENLFGTNEDIPMDDRVARAIAKVRGEIQASAMPNLPLMWTEWNVQGMNESRDTIFVGPALANTIRQMRAASTCCHSGPSPMSSRKAARFLKPFEGQFGLRAKGGINKPSYYCLWLCCISWAISASPTRRTTSSRRKPPKDHRNRRVEPGRSRQAGNCPHDGTDISRRRRRMQRSPSSASIAITAMCFHITPPWVNHSIPRQIR